MKKLLTLLLIFVLVKNSISQTFPAYNISLLAQVNPETTNNWYGGATKYASCYGWHNPADNREYAILGSTKGNHFIDITVPSSPVIVDYIPGVSQNSLWREIKTYLNYAYLVSDDGGSKLQIVDLSYLPDSVHLVYESNSLFALSHTIFVDNNKLYCGSAKPFSGSPHSMSVYDISNPVNPVLLRHLEQDYPVIDHVHDMFVKGDTVYASCGYDGLHIYHFNGSNFVELSSLTSYIFSGYNHSSYITPDSKTLVFCDEVPTGLPTKVLDISNLSNLTVTDTIVTHQGATPHNPYVTNDYHAIISAYMDGVYIYDVSNPSNAVLKGFFDTNPLHGDNDNYSASPSYQGCWAAYPYLPSGVLLASDMQNGLFILDPSLATRINKKENVQEFRLFPNPTNNLVSIVFNEFEKGNCEIQLFDMQGNQVKNMNINRINLGEKISINTTDYADGVYVIKIKTASVNLQQKFIVTH